MNELKQNNDNYDTSNNSDNNNKRIIIRIRIMHRIHKERKNTKQRK